MMLLNAVGAMPMRMTDLGSEATRPEATDSTVPDTSTASNVGHVLGGVAIGGIVLGVFGALLGAHAGSGAGDVEMAGDMLGAMVGFFGLGAVGAIGGGIVGAMTIH